MKKVISCIFAGTMLISSIGVFSAFADEPKTVSTAVVENIGNDEAKISEPSKDSTAPVGSNAENVPTKLGENTSKLEVKSFWQRNKGTILAVAGGVLAAITGVVATDAYYRYHMIPFLDQIHKAEIEKIHTQVDQDNQNYFCFDKKGLEPLLAMHTSFTLRFGTEKDVACLDMPTWQNITDYFSEYLF